MKTLFQIADQYIQHSNWKIIAALKFCLLSIGVILGSILPQKIKKPARMICGGVFLLTYIPLMLGFAWSAMRFLRERKLNH